MPDITMQKIDGWWYVLINGRPDRFGWSTVSAARDRYYQIVEGWI